MFPVLHLFLQHLKVQNLVAWDNLGEQNNRAPKASAKNFKFWAARSQNSTFKGEKTSGFPLTGGVATHSPP